MNFVQRRYIKLFLLLALQTPIKIVRNKRKVLCMRTHARVYVLRACMRGKNLISRPQVNTFLGARGLCTLKKSTCATPVGGISCKHQPLCITSIPTVPSDAPLLCCGISSPACLCPFFCEDGTSSSETASAYWQLINFSLWNHQTNNFSTDLLSALRLLHKFANISLAAF